MKLFYFIRSNQLMMKKLFNLLIVVVFYSCASSKMASNAPDGDWNYTVTGTPDGDHSGILTITTEKNKCTAIIKSETGEMTLNDAAFDKEKQLLTGNIDYDGTTVYLNITRTGDSLEGKVSASGMDFPLKGTRKK